MIKEKNVKRYCCEDFGLIENYNEAVNDTTQIWDCHHRKEIELKKNRQELIDIGLYYNRPASELIFLTHNEHTALHMKGHKNEARQKIGKAASKLFKWLTPTGEIKIMNRSNAGKHHPDWIKIGEA